MKKIFLVSPLIIALNLYAQNNLLDMDLECLAQIEALDTTATLTETERKNIPLSVTVITQKDIQESGARNLDELLEIYVSDVAYMYKVQGNQLGIGGIISDRNNKILLTLNGRNMNVKASDGGAITERWLSMLGDIKKITVISGPGSTIYGPGAIAGIINIETYDSHTFKGFESNVKGGYVEEFSSLDLKYGTKLDNGLGIFAYAGIDNYQGEGYDEAKNKVAFDYPDTGIVANEEIPFYTTNINGSYHDEIRKKFHLQLNYEDFTFWSRYTKSSMAIPTSQNLYTYNVPQYFVDTGASNEQWSSLLSYRQNIASNFDIDYSLSYVHSKIANTNNIDPTNTRGNREWVEENYDLRILSTYIPNSRTKCAFGAEYTYNKFGDSSSNIITALDVGTKWDSSMASLFGEMQTKPTENSTVFLDLRIDKHTYSTMMFSPRLAWSYNMDHASSVKFNYSHSVRIPDDADAYNNYKTNGTLSDTEEIDHFELLYTYDLHQTKVNLKASYNEQSVVAYNNAVVPGMTEYIGDVDFYTLEAIFQYKYNNYRFYFSHNYTKQLNFRLNDPSTTRQNVSASEYGYGNDLANWNNHITKLRFNYQYSKNLKLINSLQIFWGIPGSVDMADYNRDTFADSGASYYRLPVYTDGKRAFEESAYFNTSIEYKLNKSTKLSLHGYNLLGYLDEDLNKRNYFNQTSHYIDVAPSFSLFLNYKID